MEKKKNDDVTSVNTKRQCGDCIPGLFCYRRFIHFGHQYIPKTDGKHVLIVTLMRLCQSIKGNKVVFVTVFRVTRGDSKLTDILGFDLKLD